MYVCMYSYVLFYGLEDIARGVEELCKVKPPGDEAYVAPPYPTPPHPTNNNWSLNRPVVPVLFPRSNSTQTARTIKFGLGEQSERVGYPTTEDFVSKEILR
jgi:hypothetical protein